MNQSLIGIQMGTMRHGGKKERLLLLLGVVIIVAIIVVTVGGAEKGRVKLMDCLAVSLLDVVRVLLLLLKVVVMI
jgi:hypothetical protein